MEQTIFEKIINRTIPASIVHEDTDTIAILDINPTTLGHILVIPKAVSRTFIEMNSESFEHYFKIVQKISQAVKESLGADGCNILLNVEPAAGQEVFHTHTHIIPRHTDKPIPLNAGYHEKYSSPEEMEEYADKIREYLSNI